MTIKNLVHFTSHINSSLEEYLLANSFSKSIVLCDENTHRDCFPLIDVLKDFECIVVKEGEKHKNLETCTKIWEQMTAHKMDRKSLLINLGGGVIGDMGAFCAATFKRGISFIQIPTTLLAMTDAAIGSKSGVNFGGYKNHIGVFAEPRAILIDSIFLNTLEQRHLLNGFAETIKHAIIADKELWDSIQGFDLNDSQLICKIVQPSAKVKMSIVHLDPKEDGPRKKLNYGHTVGHLIESYFLKSDSENSLLHGEAIALGMVVEAILANQKSILATSDLNEIIKFIASYFELRPLSNDLKTYIKNNVGQDKKNAFGELLFALPERIGLVKYDVAISNQELEDSLIAYQNKFSLL